MNCKNCGKEISEIARFCKHCGVNLASNVIQPGAAPASQPATDRKIEQKGPPATSLTTEMFSQQEDRRKEEPIPVQRPPVVNKPRINVVYLREDRDNGNTWVVYKAPSKAVAMSFLSKNTIDRPSYYVIVETPEGNFGKDIHGIYQE